MSGTGWLLVWCCLAGADPTAASEELDGVMRSRWRDLFGQVAADYRLVREPDQTPLELVDRPVYTWARSGAYGGTYGAVYVWTDQGNAESVACFWRSPAGDGKVSVAHELHSLSPLVLTSESQAARSWQPKAGLKRQLIKSAPVPDIAAVTRLQQMRALCRDFAAHSISSRDERTELRLLPQPLYRYQSTNADLIDGALFAFVCSIGTDPELFLQLEAIKSDDGPRWHFTAARFSHLDLHLNYRGDEVWQSIRDDANPISHNADQTYWLFHKPLDRAQLEVLDGK